MSSVSQAATRIGWVRPGIPSAQGWRIWSLRVASILPIVLLLGLWELAAALKIVDPRYVPPPSRVMGTALALLASGQLVTDLAISLARIGVGFAIGASLGVLVGVSAGLSPVLRAVLNPLIVSLYSVPKSALLPVLVLMFGFGEGSKVTILAISAFFLTVVNTIEGVRMINPVYLEVARNCQANRWLVLRTVAVPGALPFVFTGLKLAWGVALILIVVAEMTAATGGIGNLLMTSWRLFKVQEMVVCLLVLGVVGYLSNLMLDGMERRVMPWRA